LCNLPDGEPERIAPGIDAAAVALAPHPEGRPHVIVTMAQGTAAIVAPDGSIQKLD
jgi:hypothetical protein